MLISGLYIVATPIGNLKDISERAKEILSDADIIAAEDTRVTKKLFTLLGLPTNKKFIPYEDHSEQEKFQQIIDLINEGNSVALVSDAGSPLISDPGYKLVRECRKQNIYVTTIPGASAVISALQLSGLPTNRFMFAGFIPNKDKARIDLFTELKNINTTLVLYETAIRLEKSLEALQKIMPAREIAVVREITKLYEETIFGSIADVLEKLKANPAKGEIALVIAPPAEQRSDEVDIESLLKEEMQKSTLKEAVKKISETYHLKRNDVYEKALQIKNQSV
ncbi:MAG: 16S rRNA (cytidine(1402)-2'-O)-methyltransferase [Alphaproteobacteria bacterium]|nr:16S rRNA (cytidine(1402)-2'-O)-methyltransferase [Alphaproteobacteria bacterium]